MELATGGLAIGILGVLFGYAWRLIRRSDRQRDEAFEEMKYDRDFWRARALGLPEPPRPPTVDGDPEKRSS